MKKWLSVLIAFAGLGHSLSFAKQESNSSPIEKYIAIVRRHHFDPVAVAFAKDCGLQLAGAQTSYGFANDGAGTWRVVQDLPRAYENFQMDLILTTQIWKVGAQVVIEEWDVALDQGGFARTLYCFDSNHRLKSLDTADFEVPIDISHSWAMHERWTRTENGNFMASTPFQYISMQEKPTVRPKLTKDELEFAKSWGKKPPKAISLVELELPAELFR